MNLTSNPWSFVPGDVQTQTISSITLNADGSVTIVGSGNLTAGMVNGADIIAINVTNPLYNGGYQIFNLSSATTAVCAPMFNTGVGGYVGRIAVGTAASSAGTVALVQYNAQVRMEDISWQNQPAAGEALDIRNQQGGIIWQATSTGAGQQNRGKTFWVNGISLVQLGGGIVLATVN